MFKYILHVDDERYDNVYKDIATGSEPGARFYILVVVSTLIASFGLVANSTAVVIGAMLVAPLMTPIFGIALGLISNDRLLLRNSVISECIGVIAAVSMAAFLGFLLILTNPYPEATPEMLARTKPNLFDLFVAVLAGFAGSYALIDEKISPALPGVAIATAIVPPLANSGLCIAYGAYNGGLGSFLLFVANFLSILLVASMMFAIARMNRLHKNLKDFHIARRFGFATVCFLAIAIFMGNSLYKMAQNSKLYNIVKKELIDEFENFPATGIEKIIINRQKEKTYILVQIYSPNQVTPDQVNIIETEIAKKTKNPTDLIVRTIKTSDTSSRGSNTVATALGLDGFFVSQEKDPIIQTIRIAEQAIREYLDDHLGLDLVDIDYLELIRGPTIMALITAIRNLSDHEIKNLEKLVRERVNNENINVIIRLVRVDLFDKDGILRYGMLNLVEPNAKQLQVRASVINAIYREFQGLHTYNIKRISSTMKESGYAFLVEISTTGLYQQSDLLELQKKVSRFSDKPIKLFAWVNKGVIVSDKGLEYYDEFTEDRLQSYTIEEKERLKVLLKSLR